MKRFNYFRILRLLFIFLGTYSLGGVFNSIHAQDKLKPVISLSSTDNVISDCYRCNASEPALNCCPTLCSDETENIILSIAPTEFYDEEDENLYVEFIVYYHPEDGDPPPPFSNGTHIMTSGHNPSFAPYPLPNLPMNEEGSISEPGTYYIRVVVWRDTNDDGEPDAIVTVASCYTCITIYDNEPTISTSAVDNTICEGESVVLQVDVNPGSTVEWTSNPEGFSSMLLNPTVSPDEQTTYIVTVSEEDTDCIGVAEITIDVEDCTPSSPCDSVEINATAEPSLICAPTCTQLSVDVPEGFHVLWTPNIGLDDQWIANPIACPTESITYTVIVYHQDPDCGFTQEVHVEVKEECNCEDLDIEVVEECQDNNTIAALLINGVAINPSDVDWLQIGWGFTNTGEFIPNQNGIIIPPNEPYSVLVAVGDGSDEPCIFEFFSEGVEGSGCPTCDFALSEICVDDGVQVLLYDGEGNPLMPGTNGDYEVAINWSYNGTSYLNENPLPVSIPIGGIYDVAINLGLDGQWICYENFHYNEVTDCMDPCDFTIQEACNGISVELSMLDADGNTIESGLNDGLNYVIIWNYNGMSYPNDNINVPLGSSYEGELYVYIGDELICHHSIEAVAEICKKEGGKRAWNEETISFNISLYPNPAQSTFNIDFGASISQAYIQVFDFSGKEVLNREVSQTDGTSINVSELKAAVYMVKISVEGQAPIFRKLAVVN